MDDDAPRYSAWDRLLFVAAERLAPPVIRGLLATCQVRWAGRERYEALVAAEGRVVAAFWHANLLIPAGCFRDLGVRILSGFHRDAEIMARVETRLGFRAIRGSSTRGGTEALRALVREAEAPFPIAMTPDGPRGPRERAKPGTVLLAKWTGRPIVPVGFAVDRAWRFRSWDRFAVPKPFARIGIAFGEWIRIRPDLGGEGVERATLDLEVALHRATSVAEALLGR